MSATAVEAAAAAPRPEPAYRGFAVELASARRLSPSFLQKIFTGAVLDQFGTEGLDQRIKLVLPTSCGARADVDLFTSDDWFEQWRALPDPQRYPLRTYTVRAVRPALREVDVDVVLHGVEPGADTGCGIARLLGCSCPVDVGPAVRWCAAAQPGDGIVLIGPNARYEGPVGGIEWRPPADADTFLLAGDETAVPAICAILEGLPAGSRAHAVLEVPTADDALPLDLPAGIEVTWLARGTGTDDGSPATPHGRLLDAAVRRVTPALVAPHPGAAGAPEDVDVDASVLWEVPEEGHASGGVYAWVAGEAGVVRGLRRYLVAEVGLDRSAVAFMGYWRAGRPAAG